ncbi:MAG: helix-turn-helix transcriptional regulator [Myxococcales bacterium]|nr:helix-turn-helix transcriptional regulator [Myxococcales bacterium]
MSTEDDFHDALAHLYQAAYEPDGFRCALTKVRELLGSSSALVAMRAPEHLAFRDFGVHENLDATALSGYAEHYHVIDPYRRLVAELPPDHVHDSDRLGDSMRLHRSEFYNDFLCAANTPRWLGLNGLTPQGAYLSFAFHRPIGGAPFDDEEHKLALRLRPHLVHAAELSARVASLKSQAAWSAGLIEQYGCPTMLLSRSAHVLLANRLAAQLLRDRSSLSSTRSGLRAHSNSGTRKLHRAIAACHDVGGTLVQLRYELRPDLVAVITPFPARVGANSADRTPRGEAWALLRVLDPSDLPDGSPALFARAFGLTPAESRIASALAKGLSLSEIAIRFGVQEGTVRNHIKRVFAKTGTTRQGELVALLTRIA